MALANFFDKISLSAAQRIKNYDRSSFENKLLSTHVAIVYGDNAVGTKEGCVAIDLAVRILARLYPNLQFKDLSNSSKGKAITKLAQTTALNINPVIDINTGEDIDISLVIGSIDGFIPNGKCFYIGSSGWKAFFSITEIKKCGSSLNPFGASGAVCIAGANIFRFLFSEELDHPELDENVCFSLFSQKIDALAEEEPDLPQEVTLAFTLVGTGAIGNAVLWSLLQLAQISGFINLIDDQDVSLTNLQRYILMFQDHKDKSKVMELKKMFAGFSNLIVNPFQNKWQLEIGGLREKDLELLVVALDSKEERLLIQSGLPKKIINAWTSQEDIGVSRHFNFSETVCLSCLYLPKQKQKSESEKIAESLNLPEPQIRQYTANSLPVDESFIFSVAQSLGVEVAELRSFIGKPVQIFYSEGICGERIISLRKQGQDLEVPLAHESVLAGILQAAEIVIESMQLRKNTIEPLTKIDLLRPLHPYIREYEDKNYAGLCICTDEVFIDRYKEKWEV